MNLAFPTLLTLVSAVIFLTVERVRPGRELPNSKGWYARAALINLCQVAITFGTNKLWVDLFSGVSLFKIAAWHHPVLEGFFGWFVGTFFFYWWHRIRHLDGFWHVFHQVHHSPARIEAITSFYKHPIEILADSALAAPIPLPAPRRLARGGAVVQLLRRDRRVLLPLELQVAAVAQVLHPDAGAALDPPPAQRPQVQFRGSPDLGSALRHLQGRGRVREPLRLPARQRAQAGEDADLPGRLQRLTLAAGWRTFRRIFPRSSRMTALSRRALLGGLAASALPMAAQAQYGGIPAGTRFSSIAVDVGPLFERRLGPYAEYVRQSLTSELRRAFADRMGPGPRLVVRVTGVSLSSYAGHGRAASGWGSAGGINDYLEGDALALDSRGQIIGAHHQVSATPSSMGGPWYDPASEQKRTAFLAYHYAQWLRRQI
jgi:Fatty acid hydroxylase superfamily